MGGVSRLYYDEPYLQSFTAQIVDRQEEGRRVYLDRTAFYPTSGGQPFDLGSLGGVPVTDVVDEGEQIAHVLSAPLNGDSVEGRIDWERRFEHMQQHTGQHLLSAVLVEAYGIPTVSFHLGSETSTIDIDTPPLDAARLAELEDRCNAVIAANLPVTIHYEDAEAANANLRKASQREGTLRIIRIGELDRSACGGTHVQATGEIGCLLLRKTEKIRSHWRLEFLCGRRAVKRSREEFSRLDEVAKSFSVGWEQAADATRTQRERLHELEKAYTKASSELNRLQGLAAYQDAAIDSDGVRRLWQERPGGLGEDLRTFAQAYTAGGKAILVAASGNAVMIAASADAGVNAGQVLKPALQPFGGRGGGSATQAQGSIPDAQQMPALLQSLRSALGFGGL